ncbi:MAG: Pepco domain-containing protein [Nitrospirales bacterium]
MSTISVIVEQTGEMRSGAFGAMHSSNQILATPMDARKIKDSLSTFSTEIGTILQGVQAKGDFHLSEVELKVELSAEGGVTLIGTAKAGIAGAITLKFSRAT